MPGKDGVGLLKSYCVQLKKSFRTECLHLNPLAGYLCELAQGYLSSIVSVFCKMQIVFISNSLVGWGITEITCDFTTHIH